MKCRQRHDAMCEANLSEKNEPYAKRSEIAVRAFNNFQPDLNDPKRWTVKVQTALDPELATSSAFLQVTDNLLMNGGVGDTYGQTYGSQGNFLANSAYNNPYALKKLPATKVLSLNNMLTEEDLLEETNSVDDEYKSLEEDIQDQASQYGNIASLKIPRPNQGYPMSAIGKAFIEYSDTASTEKAYQAFSQMNFNGKLIVCEYFEEGRISVKVGK